MKKLFIIIPAVLAAAGLIGFGIYRYQQSQQGAQAEKGAVPVQAEAAHVEKIVSKVSAKGVAELLDKTIVYPDSQLLISEVHVEAGDMVTAGQPIVTYDLKSVENLKNQLADARLELKAAELRLAQAKLPPGESELLAVEGQIAQGQKNVTDAQAQLEQIDMSISRAETDVADKQRDLEDKQALYNQGAIARSELEGAEKVVADARHELDTQKAQRQTAAVALAAAEENLSLARKQYDLTRQKPQEAANQNQLSQLSVSVSQFKLKIEQLEKQIKDFKLETVAPISGTVLTLSVSEGETADFAKAIAEIADLSNQNIVINANVPENRAAGVELNQDVEISGAGLGKTVYEGKVTKISPIAEVKQIGNAMETVVVVEVSVIGDSKLLKPGYTLNTDIVTRVEDAAVVVPLTALASSSGEDYVYVIKPDNTLERRVVETGAFTGVYAEVTNVKDSERVVTSGLDSLSEGLLVKAFANGAPLAEAGEAAAVEPTADDAPEQE